MIVECICGQEFATTQKRLDSGRGKYCSKKCMYANRTRPSGLTYDVVKGSNPTSFKPGQEPWNKGKIVKDEVHYRSIHNWIKRQRNRPDACEWCRSPGYTEWANLSHEYRREVTDWAALCRPCHRKHDSGEARGAATRLFGKAQVQEGK